ncbi:MAG: hypothetical protein AMJ75_00975 [Phycisphaerae bacterium SM1_79]|nr:MAG: hypothetical protein AMJ75_00975 [Phycisphaerae bacterium SM1_79]
MPRGGAHFSSTELARVLSHYDIGVIHQVESLSVGNRRVPKMVVTSEQGKFLLKRRPRGKDDLRRIAFAHAVQTYLAGKLFPVASLVSTRDENDTVLQLNNHIYEFFRFIAGARYDGSAQATADTGRQLAMFHRLLAGFAGEPTPRGLHASFHDSTTVRRHLRTIGAKKKTGPDKKLHGTAEVLLGLYNESSIRVNRLGFDSWDEQIVHGDWHPGNMLFSKHNIVAILDFDSIRIAPTLTDLANGMLQFSIIGGRPNPADWPDYFDEAKLLQFINGYREAAKLTKKKLHSLVDLMIETMIAEAVLPVAATGFFGHLSGLDFLKMIRRKAEWLNKNHDKLTEAICQ